MCFIERKNRPCGTDIAHKPGAVFECSVLSFRSQAKPVVYSWEISYIKTNLLEKTNNTCYKYPSKKQGTSLFKRRISYTAAKGYGFLPMIHGVSKTGY